MKNSDRNIEDMTSAICGYVFSGFDWGTEHKKLGYITSKEIATMLDEAGYGNIRQVIREFTEDLELSISLLRHADCDPPMYIRGFEDCQKRIKELLINKLKEFLKNE